MAAPALAPAAGGVQAIPAIEEAVAGMRAGGLRRIEIPGSIPQLGYPLDRSQRFTNERSLFSDKIYKCGGGH